MKESNLENRLRKGCSQQDCRIIKFFGIYLSLKIELFTCRFPAFTEKMFGKRSGFFNFAEQKHYFSVYIR